MAENPERPGQYSPGCVWRVPASADADEIQHLGFPRSSVSKESACSAGDPGLIARMGRSPGEGNGNPLQCSYLERSLAGYSPQGCIESDTTERLHFLSSFLLYYGFKTPSIVVPNLFGTRDQFCGKQFFHEWAAGSGAGFEMIQMHYIFFALFFLLLLHQLHLRPSCIRS